MVDHSLDKWHGKPSNIKLGGGGSVTGTITHNKCLDILFQVFLDNFIFFTTISNNFGGLCDFLRLP